MKEFNVSEYSDSYAFKLIVDEIVSSKFEKAKNDKRLALLQNFDKCVSYVCGMPNANIIAGDNYDNDSLNDVYISSVMLYNSGIEMLFDYFVGKRQQYQKNCVKNNDRGVYTFAQFESLKKCYTKSPITGSRVYFPYNNSSYAKYLMNVNVTDSYMYAGEQTSGILATMVDYKKLKETAKTSDEKIFVEEGLKNQGEAIKRKINMILESYNNSRLCEKIENERKTMEKKIQREWQLFKDLKDIFNDETRKEPLFICCFFDKVWPTLDDENRIKAINLLNKALAEYFNVDVKKIDYSYSKLIDTNKETIGIGDINEPNGIEILKKMLFSYSVARCDYLIDGHLVNSDYENELATRSYLEQRTCLENERYDLLFKKELGPLLVKFSKEVYFHMVWCAKDYYKGNINDVCLEPKKMAKEMISLFKKKSWRSR